ncbi:hypothetical protein ACQ4PT_002557 [Festuca glaucescens]
MSWALRSFLSRPHNLLSRLRPVGRRVIRKTTFLGRSNLIDSRGYASSPSGDLHAEVKRHLYVVLDDQEDGYRIHKLDLEDDHADQDGGGARLLPEPPVLRVALATVTERAQFASVGQQHRSKRGQPQHRLLERLLQRFWEEGHKAAVAVGGRLYMLGSERKPLWSSYQRNGGGHVHCRDPHSVFGSGWSSWEPLSYCSRWSCRQQCWNAPTPPFLANHITAYAAAAHAPAQTEHEIFVSVRASFDGDGNQLGAGTFSFSTASLEWTRRGDWQMPVHGLAHHDEGLDTWVGLHAVHDSGDMDRPRVTVTNGRLWAGQITAAPTEWKVGGEKLFRLDEDVAAGWRHLDAKLVPMTPHDGGGEYCLMERLLPSKGDKEECLDDTNAFSGAPSGTSG